MWLREEDKLTELLVFFNGFLLADFEAFGLGGDKIVFMVGHCDLG